MKTRNNFSIIFLFLLLALIASAASAQGSLYSRFGIGDLASYGGSRLAAMGGSGIGLAGDGFINLLNPAGIGRLSYTRIDGGFEYTSLSSKDANASGSRQRGGFKALAFAFPISREHGVSAMLDISPYSSVNYALKSSDSTLEQTFLGKGGLTQVSLGGSVSPAGSLLLGFKFNYIFGQIYQNARYNFSDPTFYDSEIDRSDYYGAANVSLGAIYQQVGTALNMPSLEHLTIGFVLSTPSTFSIDRERTYLDTTFTSAANADLPASIGFGASYLIDAKYVLTADIAQQYWGTAKFFGTVPPELKNSTRFSAGFEVIPQRDRNTFISQMTYRAGFSYNSSYLTFGGTAIEEFSATAGFGFPIGIDANLNLGLQVGTRGTTSNKLQRDTFFRLNLSLSASEMWFLQFDQD
ncbi:MAG: hypothetical protein V1799_17290 [bacterium]